jgi:rfaE bifunctional protein kinase chain/domain
MKKLEDIRILVIGDIMLDKYVVGDVNRISPEAPVQIVQVIDEYSNLGGCGNVVKNIRDLGVQVDCVASIGFDRASETISQKLNDLDIGDYLIEESDIAIVKERIVANSRKIQMLRIDREIIKKVHPDIIIEKLQEYFTNHSPNIIIVSDYAKGMIGGEVMTYLKEQPYKIIVDPKPQHTIYYNGVFMITPNEKEWAEIQIDFPHVPPDVNYLLITKGKHGMYLEDFNQSWNIPAEEVHAVYNLSGAGDTVIAMMGVCLSLDLSPVQSAKIANACAAYVVTKPDTSTVPKELFLEIIKEKTRKTLW